MSDVDVVEKVQEEEKVVSKDENLQFIKQALSYQFSEIIKLLGQLPPKEHKRMISVFNSSLKSHYQMCDISRGEDK